MTSTPGRASIAALALLAAGVAAGATPAAADQGCTGQTTSTGAQTAAPFGANVVAPTAQSTDFGQDVIRPEATAPRDDCP